MAANNQWFYKIMGEEIGPITPAAFKSLADDGTISRDTLVRRGTDGAWVLAGNVNGLFAPTPKGSKLKPANTATLDEVSLNAPHVTEGLMPTVAAATDSDGLKSEGAWSLPHKMRSVHYALGVSIAFAFVGWGLALSAYLSSYDRALIRYDTTLSTYTALRQQIQRDREFWENSFDELESIQGYMSEESRLAMLERKQKDEKWWAESEEKLMVEIEEAGARLNDARATLRNVTPKSARKSTSSDN